MVTKMIVSGNELYHLKSALQEAIKVQEMYERSVLKFIMDSAMLASWRKLLADVSKELPN